ncbi:MAG TPA: hypothetical protein VFZ68_15835 [Acidimicrobiales bacterium]
MTSRSESGRGREPGHEAGRGQRPAWAEHVGPSTLRRAVRATATVERGRVEVRTELTGLGGADGAPEGIEAVGMVHRAVFDRRAGRAAAETDMSDLATVAADATADYTRPARMVVDGDSVYTQVGPLAGELGLSPESWVRRDLDSVLDRGIDSETAALLLAPLGMIEVLLTPVRAIRVVGDGVAGGVDAVHLAATLDLVAARALDPEPSGSDTFTARLHAAGVGDLPVDVWLDAGRVLRRLAVRLDRGLVGGSGPEGLTTTFELHDVGVDPGISPPEPADVVDAAEVARRSGP